MKGLEINEVPLSTVLANKDCRIDSSFFTSALIRNPALHYIKIGKLLLGTDYGISVSMSDIPIGYPIYRMNEIHNMLCDEKTEKYVVLSPSEANAFLLKDRDVLFNRTNSFDWVGRTGLYYQNDNISRIFASYLVRLSPNQELILPEYLVVFLSSKIGIMEIRKRARPSVNQTNVNPEEVKEIEIPLVGMEFQKKIASCFKIANQHLVNSGAIYQSAEAYLLEELGIQNWRPSKKSTTIETFKRYRKIRRLDAEYYQPKYFEIMEKLNQYKHGTVLCESFLVDAMTKLDADIEYCYIELADIGKSGEIVSCTKDFAKNLPSRARQRVKTNDVIVSSIEGSLSSCALITEEYNNAICSTGFHVLRSSKINPETLLLLMKSWPIQALLKQGCSGTILTAILPDSLKEIELPLINEDIQTELANKIQESIALRIESKRFLDLAKKAVETAIEQNESIAFAMLQTEIKE